MTSPREPAARTALSTPSPSQPGRDRGGATAAGREAPVISPDGTAYWDGSAWQPLPGTRRSSSTTWSRTAVVGWVAVGVLALALPGGLVLSAAGQSADLTRYGAAEPAGAQDDGTSYGEQRRLAATQGGRKPTTGAAPSVVPMGERAEAADLCQEETEDRLVRHCPDGSAYDVPAAEALLQAEAPPTAPPKLQVLRLDQTGQWDGVQVSVQQDGIYTSRQVTLTFEADANTQVLVDPYDVYALHGRNRRELKPGTGARPMTLNPGERGVLSWYCDGCTYQDEMLSVMYAPGGQPVLRFDP